MLIYNFNSIVGKSFLQESDNGALLDVVVGNLLVVHEQIRSERQHDDFRIFSQDFSDPGFDGRDLLVLADQDFVLDIGMVIFH
jgi:hypothetical protein